MSGESIPKTERDADFKHLDKLILSLEHNADTNKLTIPMLKHYQQSLDKIIAKYEFDPSFGSSDKGLFKPGELHALIFLAQGNGHMADVLLREAKSFMKPGEHWVSESVKKWDSANYVVNGEQFTTQVEPKRFNGKLEGMLALYAVGLVVSPLFSIYAIVQQSSFRSGLDKLNPSVASLFNSLTSTAYVLNVLTIIAMVGLAYPFFTKMKITKPLAIAFSSCVFIAGLVLYIMYDSALQKVGTNIDAVGGTGSSFGALSIIWVFYWIFSRRVKDTFVN